MNNHHSDSWNIPSESIRWPRFLKHCSHNQYNYRCTQNKPKVISKPLSRIACAGCQHCWTVGNWPEETTRKNTRRTVGSAAMETDGRLPVRVVVVFSQGEVELWDTVWKVDKLRLGCSWHVFLQHSSPRIAVQCWKTSDSLIPSGKHTKSYWKWPLK